jgi:hypothetical protein
MQSKYVQACSSVQNQGSCKKVAKKGVKMTYLVIVLLKKITTIGDP